MGFGTLFVFFIFLCCKSVHRFLYLQTCSITIPASSSHLVCFQKTYSTCGQVVAFRFNNRSHRHSPLFMWNLNRKLNYNSHKQYFFQMRMCFSMAAILLYIEINIYIFNYLHVDPYYCDLTLNHGKCFLFSLFMLSVPVWFFFRLHRLFHQIDWPLW